MRHTSCAFDDEDDGGGGTRGAEMAEVAIDVESTSFEWGMVSMGTDGAIMVGAMTTSPPTSDDGRR